MKLISIFALMLVIPGFAKDKKKAPNTPQDSIDVLAHLPISTAPILRFTSTDHYSSHYLYAESAGKTVMLIDVSTPVKPIVLGDVGYPSPSASESLVVATGTAALVTDRAQAPSPTQTLRILDFSDPLHPKVAKEFLGVTATARDDARGLIFVANAEGLWILHQNHALDPEIEKAYAHHVVYDH